MKFAPVRIAACATLAAASLAVQAQPAAPAPGPAQPPQAMPMHPGMHDGHARMGEHRQERFQRRMDGLKRILQLQPAQEGAWNTWVAAMRPPQAMPRHDREAFERMTTPQRIDAMRQMRAQRQAEMDKRADATKSFYAQLNPSQQKAFDEISLKFFARMAGHRHGHRHEM